MHDKPDACVHEWQRAAACSLSGLCGSAVGSRRGRNGTVFFSPPLLLSHEIVAVAVERRDVDCGWHRPSVPRGTRGPCSRGNPHLCPNGTYGARGTEWRSPQLHSVVEPHVPRIPERLRRRRSARAVRRRAARGRGRADSPRYAGWSRGCGPIGQLLVQPLTSPGVDTLTFSEPCLTAWRPRSPSGPRCGDRARRLLGDRPQRRVRALRRRRRPRRCAAGSPTGGRVVGQVTMPDPDLHVHHVFEARGHPQQPRLGRNRTVQRAPRTPRSPMARSTPSAAWTPSTSTFVMPVNVIAHVVRLSCSDDYASLAPLTAILMTWYVCNRMPSNETSDATPRRHLLIARRGSGPVWSWAARARALREQPHRTEGAFSC